MSTAELNDTTTKEEMQQMVEELTAERIGEEKSDAQIASEHAGKPAQKEPPAETESGSDTAPEGEDTAEEGEDTGNEETSEETWLDDDLRAEIAANGFEESEFADFTSREEFQRALRLFDKSALEAGRKALAEPEEGEEKGQARNEKGQFAKTEEPKTDPPETREGQYEFKTDVYDEDLEGDLKGFRDHMEQRFAALDDSFARLAAMEERLSASEARFAEAEALAIEQRFDAAIDALDMPKLFGTTGKETPDELEKREEILAQAKVLQAGYHTFGREVEVDALVSRVAPMLFASEFDKRKLKERTRKISKQSDSRQGGGATRPQDPREDPRDEADRLFREMERA